jgi:Flp pilus assembly protein TadG
MAQAFLIDGASRAAGGACRGFRPFWRALAACRRGAAAIEFAFAAPAFVFVSIGLIEISMILFVNTLMEGGLRDAARFGVTGGVPAGHTRAERILDIIDARTIGLIPRDEAQITTLVYPSFDAVGKPEPFVDKPTFNGTYDAGEAWTDINGNGRWDADMGAVGLGGPGDIVLYTIDYDWPLITGHLFDIVGIDGKVPLRASLIARNEPYGSD